MSGAAVLPESARTPDAVTALALSLASERPALAALGLVRRARAVATAAAALAAPDTAEGKAARQLLPAASGLSAAMVDWALDTSLASLSADALVSMVRAALSPPAGGRTRAVLPRLVSVVLAGNVFTAAIRPMLLPLVLGAPVLCKASSRDDTLPRLLCAALLRADPDVGRALGVATFAGGDLELERALVSASDVAVVYGSDDTVAALRARLPATLRLIEHGHGVGAAYLGARALASMDAAARAARQLALDVAAYDQRGCLSPMIAWVRRGAAVDGVTQARLVHEALARLEAELPRGPLPAAAGAAQMQWRGVAATLGELFEGEAHAVAYDESRALHLGPGWRNLVVRECDGPAELAAGLAPLGVHLKALGIACDPAEEDALLAALPAPLCPRISALGRMQTPGLHSLAEGQGPLHDLIRWLAIETTAG